jgi:G6PDH family F420-dependent oxidoreductase
MKIGYFVHEEYPPAELLSSPRRRAAGFEALGSPTTATGRTGQSPFVWSVIGAISQVCDLPVTTAVTCPTVRTHPAVIAQAAATSAVMLDGRFVLGVGSGEALNEHVLGDAWPTADVRLAMLEEAVDVIRRLFTGETVTYGGEFYTVDTARIYTLPDQPPPIYVSGFGPKAVDSRPDRRRYVSTMP